MQLQQQQRSLHRAQPADRQPAHLRQPSPAPSTRPQTRQPFSQQQQDKAPPGRLHATPLTKEPASLVRVLQEAVNPQTSVGPQDVADNAAEQVSHQVKKARRCAAG